MNEAPVNPSPAVLVTGTSSGIGRATARLLDGEGWRIFAGVRREEDAESLRAEGSTRVRPLLLDVTDAASVAQAAKDVDSALAGEPLVGLVNNAGIGFGGPLEFIDLDEVRRGFEVNVFGPLAVTRAFLPLLRRAPGARIVNVSSGAGVVSTPLLGPYCASKFALEALSDALRLELRGTGLQVAIVEPGFIDTPMQEKGRSDFERVHQALPPEGRALYGAALDKQVELFEKFGKRAAPPESVARAILDALTAARARTRTPVGGDARLMHWLKRLLPDRGKDAILGRLTGL